VLPSMSPVAHLAAPQQLPGVQQVSPFGAVVQPVQLPQAVQFPQVPQALHALQALQAPQVVQLPQVAQDEQVLPQEHLLSPASFWNKIARLGVRHGLAVVRQLLDDIQHQQLVLQQLGQQAAVMSSVIAVPQVMAPQQAQGLQQIMPQHPQQVAVHYAQAQQHPQQLAVHYAQAQQHPQQVAVAYGQAGHHMAHQQVPVAAGSGI
jgi:hypothetical protein